MKTRRVQTATAAATRTMITTVMRNRLMAGPTGLTGSGSAEAFVPLSKTFRLDHARHVELTRHARAEHDRIDREHAWGPGMLSGLGAEDEDDNDGSGDVFDDEEEDTGMGDLFYD
jgi:hypothetical protein